MLVVETIGRIRRAHLSQGKSIKEIARELKISRNTVRKIRRSDETSFSYEREVQPRPKLGSWKARPRADHLVVERRLYHSPLSFPQFAIAHDETGAEEQGHAVELIAFVVILPILLEDALNVFRGRDEIRASRLLKKSSESFVEFRCSA